MAKRLPRARTLKGQPPLAYYDSGAGTAGEFAILIIHGSTSRSEDWENIFPRLATRYRTVVYDQRGHGKSGRATSYSLRDFADDALRMTREVVKAPVVVIGHSLGSLCAIGVAAQAPETVLGLVLEDPPVAYTKNWKADSYTQLRDGLLASADDPKVLLRFVERLPLASPGPRGERTFGETRGFYAADRIVSYYRDLDPQFAASRIAGSDEVGVTALEEWLPAVRCPVLVMAGESRLGSALDDASEWRLKQSIKDLTVKRFPGLGHLIHGPRPEQFLENVEPFLRRLRAAPA